MDDTIAAIATAAGAGGVGIVRLSGPSAVSIAAAMLGRDTLSDRRVVVGVARDLHGARVDQVLAFALHAPRSFTGEDVAELHGHGGGANLERLLSAVLARGARLATPGEFTRRALAHGKLELTQAEALLAVIEAGSARALRAAQAQLGGELGRLATTLHVRLVDALAQLEGAIDFPAEAGELAATWSGELAAVEHEARALAASYAAGRVVREGLVVALVGPVNAGKSSLLNALAGEERALVDARAGTTRDVVEARLQWDGVEVTLLDTAGERPAADVDLSGELEARGVVLGRARAQRADVVLVVDDGRGPTPWLAAEAWGARALRVQSKVDLAATPLPGAQICTSATTGAGLDELRREVLRRAAVGDADGVTGVLVTSARQHQLLARCAAELADARTVGQGGGPLELAAVAVRSAAGALAELLGRELGEDVLDQVFARFCIGK